MWAAEGKISYDKGSILGVSRETDNEHTKACLRSLMQPTGRKLSLRQSISD